MAIGGGPLQEHCNQNGTRVVHDTGATEGNSPEAHCFSQPNSSFLCFLLSFVLFYIVWVTDGNSSKQYPKTKPLFVTSPNGNPGGGASFAPSQEI